jgi:hypothetical protein
MSEEFLATHPLIEDYWRAIILFGLNAASYKFSLANALFDLKASSGKLVTFDELAVPFSRHIYDHLKIEEKQSTSPGSRFLDSCRKSNSGEITETELVEQTVPPLRETLILQTGNTERFRRSFLNDFHNRARAALIHEWEPAEINGLPF